MAEGDQLGWNVLTYAAAPATWGQDMEVPDNILYLTLLWSVGNTEGETTGEYAAKISIPGAVTSGCNIFYIIKQLSMQIGIRKIGSGKNKYLQNIWSNEIWSP